MSKVLTMTEAISRYVANGSSIALGLALEPLIPFAAGHEIIRQHKQNLTLIGPISDILFDQLIGAGCVNKISAAWVGNVSEGLGHCYRRAVEKAEPHALIIEEQSNFTIGLALLAAGLGAPYIPTRTLLGSDLADHNASFMRTISPLDRSPILLIPALKPDLAIIHVQRSDSDGNAHLWGNSGISSEAFMAARDVMIVAEELVNHKVIISDPNRVLGPAFKVRAVVHEPWGAYPSMVQGHYNRDHRAYQEYHKRTRSPAGFQEWLAESVLGVKGREEYLKKLGLEELQRRLGVKQHRYAAQVDYGY